MNKIFNKLFLGLAVCGLAMTACSDGVEWEPSPVPTEGVQAYIYADNTAIPEEDSYVYGSPKVTVNIKRDYTWLNIGTGYYTSQLFGEGWDQPVLKAKEANIYKLEDCITKGYPIMFTLSDDNQELIGWDPQPTGYDKTDYGMLYFAAAGMERKGNVLSFPMQGLVVLDSGKWGVLYQGFTETLEMPEGF